MVIASAWFPRRTAWSFALLLAGLGLGCSSGPSIPDQVATRLGLAVAPSTSATNGTALTQQPVIQVLDADGNAMQVSGRLVVASLTPAGAVLGGVTELRTDAQGRATFTGLTITGPVGERVMRFESSGLASVTAPAIQVSAGAATDLAIVAGNLQTATAGTAVPIAPTVQVNDGSGNPVTGASVTFAVAGGLGQVVGGTVTTGADGRAKPTSWTLGNEIGLNTLVATSPAVPGATASFTATGVLGPPAMLTIISGDGQTAIVGGAVETAPSVKLTDALGHPLPNVAVTFTATSGGGTVTVPNPLTDADGIATVGAWSVGPIPGANNLTASRAGVPSVVISATGIHYVLSQIAAGGEHSCGRDGNGTVWCWGSNQFRQIGNNTTADTTRPAQVGTGFSHVTSGFFHSCGLIAGAAWCWGGNSQGQLGDGSTTDRAVPVAVSGGHTFVALDAGDQFTCGLKADGSMLCWGRNNAGQVGDGSIINRNVPTPVLGGHVFNKIDAGSVHTCATEGAGVLWCWGSNGQGRLGDGTIVSSSIPVQVSGSHQFASFAAGDSFTCGVTTAGAGYCWGNGSFGALGTGTLANQSNPTAVSGGLLFSVVHTSGGHTCALTTQNQVYCWGSNNLGQIADGTFTQRNVPTPTSGGLTWSAISVGISHTCALSMAGGAYCWGSNGRGRLGDGTTALKNRPVGVVKP